MEDLEVNRTLFRIGMTAYVIMVILLFLSSYLIFELWATNETISCIAHSGDEDVTDECAQKYTMAHLINNEMSYLGL